MDAVPKSRSPGYPFPPDGRNQTQVHSEYPLRRARGIHVHSGYVLVLRVKTQEAVFHMDAGRKSRSPGYPSVFDRRDHTHVHSGYLLRACPGSSTSLPNFQFVVPRNHASRLPWSFSLDGGLAPTPVRPGSSRSSVLLTGGPGVCGLIYSMIPDGPRGWMISSWGGGLCLREYLPREHLSRELLPREPLPREHLPRDYLPRKSLPREPLPREYLPRDPLAREHLPRELLPREYLPREYLPRAVGDDTCYSNARRLTSLQVEKVIFCLFIHTTEYMLCALANYLPRLH